MRIKSIHLKKFKRFTDTVIQNIPQSARLVVLAGPNGSGKSSIFDGMHTWHGAQGAPMSWDVTYGLKAGETNSGNWQDHVTIEFHEELPAFEERRKLVYLRTAFRNQADFAVSEFKVASPLDESKVQRMIDNDMNVSENYNRLVMRSIQDLYGDHLPADMPRENVRDRLIGEVRAAMTNVFPDLTLKGVDPIGSSANRNAGTFYFEKGSSKHFLYKNLSAGEKAVFDLLLDAVLKREFFDDSIWCIDEPEAHLNTRIQGNLLDALLAALPPNCQLWIASHSIGFMSQARKLMNEKPGAVVFIDMFDRDFDSPVVLEPVTPDRDFWSRTLDVALGDLADLIAPRRVVLCEGRPADGRSPSKTEFDARCYRQIFAEEFPDTDFLSVGNSDDVQGDRLQVGRAIQALVSGTAVIRLIDRDLRSDSEVDALKAAGVRVLSRRHLEAYLLDEEVITALCVDKGQPEKSTEAITLLRDQLASNTSRGKDTDDYKAAGGELYTKFRRLLELEQSGTTFNVFACDTLARLVKPGMQVYQQLKQDVFGT